MEELKRLQTFPDGYKIKGKNSRVIQQIGNSVPPHLARILAISIMDQLFNQKNYFDLEYDDGSHTNGSRLNGKNLTNYYRSKASKTLENYNDMGGNKIISSIVKFDLTDGFKVDPQENGSFLCNSYLDNEDWIIELNKSNNGRSIVSIDIVSTADWSLPCRKITLRSYLGGAKSYTALWRILDHLLEKQRLKANLIQLSGYYLYTPMISYTLDISESGSISTPYLEMVLRKFTGVQVVRKPMTGGDLSSLLGVRLEELERTLTYLSELGFEIRYCSGTENYLIPYAFPTAFSNKFRKRNTFTQIRS